MRFINHLALVALRLTYLRNTCGILLEVPHKAIGPNITCRNLPALAAANHQQKSRCKSESSAPAGRHHQNNNDAIEYRIFLDQLEKQDPRETTQAIDPSRIGRLLSIICAGHDILLLAAARGVRRLVALLPSRRRRRRRRGASFSRRVGVTTSSARGGGWTRASIVDARRRRSFSSSSSHATKHAVHRRKTIRGSLFLQIQGSIALLLLLAAPEAGTMDVSRPVVR